MTADDRLKARIAAMTDAQLRAAWAEITARPRRMARDEALILCPRVGAEMQRRNLPLDEER